MRRFLIRNAAAEVVGEGVERANKEIAARIPIEINGSTVGSDLSLWEDAEMATWWIRQCLVGETPPDSRLVDSV